MKPVKTWDGWDWTWLSLFFASIIWGGFWVVANILAGNWWLVALHVIVIAVWIFLAYFQLWMVPRQEREFKELLERMRENDRKMINQIRGVTDSGGNKSRRTESGSKEPK